MKLRFMAVYIRGGGHMGMAEAAADAHTVDSVEEQHAGLRVPECVWVDMGQPMTLAELCQPVADVSGEHRRSVLPRKQVIIVLPLITPSEFLFPVPLVIFRQQLHGLVWQSDIPDGTLRLRCVLVNPQFLAVKKIAFYVNLLILPVNLAPFQAKHFTPAASCHQK